MNHSLFQPDPDVVEFSLASRELRCRDVSAPIEAFLLAVIAGVFIGNLLRGGVKNSAATQQDRRIDQQHSATVLCLERATGPASALFRSTGRVAAGQPAIPRSTSSIRSMKATPNGDLLHAMIAPTKRRKRHVAR